MTPDSTRVPRSMALYERATKLIPGATQLISRRPNRVAYGVSPVYAARAAASFSVSSKLRSGFRSGSPPDGDRALEE